MDKEEEQNTDININSSDSKTGSDNVDSQEEIKSDKEAKDKIEDKEITPEEKIIELEDKLTRTFAEMENQRRRFEKEKEEAFNYGGFAFAKEALNLIDNLERSKLILENDEKLKDTEALKKTIEHLNPKVNRTYGAIKKLDGLKISDLIN